MKFKFKLEKVLKHKQILEKQAQRDLGEALKKLDEQLNLLKDLEEKLKNTYNLRYGYLNSSSDVCSNLSVVQQAQEGYKIMITNQKRVIEGLNKIVEEKRMRLIEAARDKKVFENLKQKKKDEFKKLKQVKELKRIDEQNLNRIKEII